ncbi:hypothetical protein D3C73_1086880 [compost metagenome]
MLISITVLIPKRLRKYGMVRMKPTSAICDTDSKIEGYFTTKLPANSGLRAKSCRNGLPKTLVICSTAPSIMAKRKNIAIRGFLNSTNASSPSLPASVVATFFSATGIFGKVNAYIASSNEAPEAIYSWALLSSSPIRLTVHIATIKPIVPNTRIGGKAVTGSWPDCARQEYETLFDNAIVGI